MIFKSFTLPAAMVLASATATIAQDTPRDPAQEAANLELVTEFYEGVFIDHDVAASASVVAEDYIQHNPHVADGKAPFVDYFTSFFAETPEATSKIVRSAASGDLVWLHVHSTTGADDLGRAIVDIFRVEDGMIVEHWDVVQPVPAEAANDNTMF